MDKILSVINQLESEGVIGRYAIGGAIGAMFYAEPVATYDLDIFCSIPNTGLVIDLSAVFKRAQELGFSINEEGAIVMEGVPVQFLVPPHGLEEEALEKAVKRVAFGIPTRVFTYEHLLAIMAKTGRPKDHARITQCLSSKTPDSVQLTEILGRYGLLDKWAKITG